MCAKRLTISMAGGRCSLNLLAKDFVINAIGGIEESKIGIPIKISCGPHSNML